MAFQNDFMAALMSTAPVPTKRKKTTRRADIATLNGLTEATESNVNADIPVTDSFTAGPDSTVATAETLSQPMEGKAKARKGKPLKPATGLSVAVSDTTPNTEPHTEKPQKTASDIHTKIQSSLKDTAERTGSSTFSQSFMPIPEVCPKSYADNRTEKHIVPAIGTPTDIPDITSGRSVDEDWLDMLAAYPTVFAGPDASKPLRVAAYIRVSTESDNQEDSYETQHGYFIGILADNPLWTSAGVYSDYGISGTSRERRRGFNRLMRHCEEGRIDRIVTKSISRFARNTADFLKALEILKKNHITIAFEKERLDTAIGQNDLMVTAFGALAQEEARSISVNIRQGLEHRMPKGEVRNVVIYGYRYSGETEVMSTGYKRRSIEIVPEEAEIVKRIFMEFVDGKGYQEIARGLNFDHIPKPETPVTRYRESLGQTPIGTLNVGIDEGWTARHMKQILSLERYCGDALLQKTFMPDYKIHKSVKNTGERPQYYVKDNHPAIIDRGLFNEAQAMMEMGQKRPGNNGVRYPFSGRIVCSGCGRFYRTSNRQSNPIWYCPTARNNNGKSVCHAERIYEEQLVRMCRKAVTERFEVIGRSVRKDEETILDGGVTVDWGFTAQGCGLVRTLLTRMEHIHEADGMEHDLTFLGQRISQTKDDVEYYTELVENLEAAKDAAVVRHEALGEPLPDMDAMDSRIRTARKKLTESENLMEELTGKKAALEAYWNDLEADYEWRRKAIAWMKGLPQGREGTAEFLNGLTNEYLKAFVLYIEVIDPLNYRIRWFDDSWSDVVMYSNVEY